MGKTKDRNYNLDLIRCVAILSVLSVHFFLNNGFYSEVMIGEKMYVATIMRQGFMICVPLFIMLTGYLMHRKQISLRYFVGIKRVLIVYALCTICILIYKIFCLKERMSVLDMIFNITSYQQYSWYIEMYIGLFLLIPFLNVLYHGLEEKRKKQMLILVLMVLVIVPSVFNILDTTIISVTDTKIAPAWWIYLYPLLYYYLGAYLSEFHSSIRLKLSTNLLLIIAAVILSGTFSYLRCYGKAFIWGQWGSYNGFTTLIVAVLVFLFLLRVKMEKWHPFLKRVIVKISEVSLSMYLLSWIFDNYAYPILNEKVPFMRDRIVYYFIVVPFVFGCSFVLGTGIDFLYKKIDGIWKKRKH